MQSERRILVVDDAPINIRQLSQVLRDSYSVCAATDGETALELALTQPLDLILLDVMMPGMDGYEVCRRLKNDPRTQALPVIFITAQEDDQGHAAKLGAAGFLTKPIDPAAVRSLVAACLEKDSP